MATRKKAGRRPVASRPDSANGEATGDRRAAPPPGRRADGQAARVRAEWGVSRKTFARMTGISERTLAAWEGGATVGEAGQRRLRELERLREALGRVIRGEFLPRWLDIPNQAFGGLKPLEVLERGEADRLWGMVYYLESGVPS